MGAEIKLVERLRQQPEQAVYSLLGSLADTPVMRRIKCGVLGGAT